jgi:hypothetical protein
MKPHLIFLHQMPVSERDFRRWGFAKLIAKGIKVSCLDVCDIAMPQIPHDRSRYAQYTSIDVHVIGKDDKDRMRDILSTGSLVLCAVGSGFPDPDNIDVLRALSRSGRPSLMFSASAIPVWGRGGARNKIAKLSRGADLKKSVYKRLPLSVLGVRPIEIAVYGGRLSRIPRPMVTDKTRPVCLHAEDYEVYRDALERKDEAGEQDIAVFLDQGFCFHPGFMAPGFSHIGDVDYVYPRLRALFDKIENDLKLRVVIAAHPKVSYRGREHVFGNREIVDGGSAGLVCKSRLAITAYSTSANLAVMDRKPLLVYSMQTIKNLSYALDAPGALAGALGTKVHYIDNPQSIDIRDAMILDDAAYDAFMVDFIRGEDADSRRWWELLHDETLKYAA